MPRVIATLLFASIFITTVYSEDVLKCYMCTSLTSEDCDSDMKTNSLQPLECTGNNMMEWQRSIKQHNVLKPLARLFEIDDTLLYYQSLSKNTACVKMFIKIEKQDIIVRTCQTAKTELIDPCKTMENKLKVNMLGTIEQCALCLKDACNGTMSLSSKIFYTFLSLFSTLIAFYHL
ncbi:hypothetical protein ALC53_07733 [Atta colombica]|uniref:Uncharacterized protein n=1 Tax=Atta colombica TaxID=520822 RepID=A0A195BC19_9HYME|nr:PREDICTED: uncharacterized protein LOC108688117 [Atta colombica]KYM81740.1 hypothetical protein ALC53_07733 [Atta colombica]